jgi:uncharacterized SAM-binding protein YcdF (DUF218 family)
MPSAGFLWHRRLRLVQRRMLWCPTWLGAFCVAFLLAAPAVWCFCYGESFLSLTDRQPADVLVVEGWIGPEAIRAAAAEFQQRGYQYVVATGGMTSGERWEQSGWSYAEGAEHALFRSGVPPDKIIAAPARQTENQRTFENAVAVWRALQARGIHPKALNVFTLGPHARRSLSVFAKVCQPGTQVGVIGWVPPGDASTRWWQSSDRARELLAEAAGYLFESLFNSGRSTNSPSKTESTRLAQHIPG